MNDHSTSPQLRPDLVFFLGGRDLEMVTIAEILSDRPTVKVHDKGLSWGAHASAYRAEIDAALAAGEVPVLVELEDDIDLTDTTRRKGGPTPIAVDHHGARAGRDQPTSLHQVFELLGMDRKLWTRWFDLVAANDRGYISAMREIGATDDEVLQVRAADRAAQGITPEQEAQGEYALRTAQIIGEGRLTVVGLPHDRTAVIADRIAMQQPEASAESLLILGRDAVHFFGAGRLVISLNGAFPGGWYGGALPGHGFWGHSAPVPGALSHLLDNL